MKNLHNTTGSIAETLKEASSLCNDHGITRLADITDFSLIKLPVWIGIRPNAKCLSQSAGKGMSSNAAKLSALMEGLEVSFAESFIFKDYEVASINSKSIKNLDCVDLDSICIHRNLLSQELVEWVKIKEINKNEEAYIPWKMLSLNFCLDNDSPYTPRKFQPTSNGVASGKTLIEASVSALLEIVERHSITLQNKLISHLHLIDIEDLKSDHIQYAINEIKKGGGELMLFDATVINGIYTFEAVQWSKSKNIPITHGSGASLDPETAILRAILEANQAATIILSGSRDDITKSMYTTITENRNVIKSYKSKAKEHTTVNVLKDFPPMSPDKELSLIVEKVSSYIGQPIYRHIYTKKEDCISVVKIIIPRMEGYYLRGYKPVSQMGINLNKKPDIVREETFDLAAGGQG